MNCEGSPLLTTGMEIGVLNMKVASGDSLRSEAVEEGYSRARGDTYWREGREGREGGEGGEGG